MSYETLSARVRNLEQFVKAMREIWDGWELWTATLHPWFRGQSLETWELLPAIYRGKHEPTREREMIRDFKTKALNYLPQMPVSNLECMFIMQHHGMPTRLLDWSENYLCALYFAVSHTSHNGDAAVWVLNPWALNETALGNAGVPTADSEELISYERKDSIAATVPAAIRPNYHSRRLAAQRGVFTLHGNQSVGLETLIVRGQDRKPPLFKVIIDGTAKLLIQKELFVGGVSSSSLFPDLDGLCAELSLRYSDEYLQTYPSTDAAINTTDAALAKGSREEGFKTSSGPTKKDAPQRKPIKESVRINLPPKPTRAPTIKLPILPPQTIMEERGQAIVPPPAPPPTIRPRPDEPYDDYSLTPSADYFVFQNWKKYDKRESERKDE